MQDSTTAGQTLAFYCSSTSWGGLEMNFIRYARWMADRGHRIRVFCVAQSPIAEHAEGLETHYIRRNRKYFDFRNAWLLQKLFRKYRVGVVWLRDARDMSVIGMANQLSGNAFKIVYHQAMQLGVKKRDIFHTIRFKQLDAWIALLPYLAEQIKTHTRLDPRKIHVVPLAAKIELPVKSPEKSKARATLGLNPDAFIIGILGRIAPMKGHDFLIEQLPALRQYGAEIELVFVGEPTRREGEAYLNTLKSMAGKLNMEPYVHFRPFMEDVTTFYGAIDLYAMASEGETFGNVTIEAMLCGAPILGTIASGTPELLGDGKYGYLYPVGDGPAFCRQVEHILSHPAEVAETAQLAMENAKKQYNKEAVCEQLELVLRKIGYKK